MRVNEHILYEPDDSSPPLVTLGVGLQGAILMVSNTIMVSTVYALAFDADESYLPWAVFTALLIGGAVTALQAAKLGRLGAGYILMMGPGVPLLAACVLAVNEGGLAVMSSLVVASSLVMFAVAAWLVKLRRIITPVVAGVSFMMIAASAMPIAVTRLNDVPSSASPVAGPAVGAATLAAAALLILRASGYLRFFAMPIAILVGCVAAGLFGLYDFTRLVETPWFALPDFSAWPGLSTDLDGEFWALMVVFVVIGVVVGVLAAVLMSAVLEMTVSRRRRLETELDMEALPGVDAFLRGLGSRMRWDQASIERLSAAGEETLSSMLQLRDDYEEEGSPRLVIVARPGVGTVEMEFLAVFAEFADRIVDVVAAHGGRYIVRSDSAEVITGDWTPDRVVVIEFESVERARGWIDSPEYRELVDLRLGGANTSMVIVEGV